MIYKAVYKIYIEGDDKMAKDSKNKAINQKQNKAPSNNKGNSQGMNTLQTTKTHKNPNPQAT